MNALTQLAHSVANKVEKSLGFKLKEFEKNLLFTGDKVQRNYQRFFRDLFNISTPSQDLKELSKSHITDLLIDENITKFVNNTEFIEEVAGDVLESFRHYFNAGHYSLGHIPPPVASQDIEVLLKNLNNRNYEKVLRMYYGLTLDDKSYSIPAIAQEMDKSKQRISDIRNGALKKIRDSGLIELVEKYSSIAVKTDIKDQVIIPKLDSLIRKLEGYEKQIKEAPTKKVEPGPEQYLDESIKILEPHLSTVTYNALKRTGFDTIKEVVEKTEKELANKYRGFGKIRTAELKEVLVNNFGLIPGKEYD